MGRPRMVLFAAAVLLLPLMTFADAHRALAPTLPSRAEHPFHAYPLSPNSHGDLPKDDDGIVLTTYYGKPQHNPVTISQAGLYFYNDWLATNSASSGETFMKYADWLVANQSADGLWLYDFRFENEPQPWWSAMAQGQAISLLLRAGSVSHDPRYMAAAALAMTSFDRSIEDYGVRMSDNGTWYEEYLPPAYLHVLNGMIFAMLGPYEYWEDTGDVHARAIWDAGVETVADNLWRYDSGSWSYYDADKHRCPTSYHLVHIRQLALLYDLTGRPVFDTYRLRFLAYYNAATKQPASPSPSTR